MGHNEDFFLLMKTGWVENKLHWNWYSPTTRASLTIGLIHHLEYYRIMQKKLIHNNFDRVLDFFLEINKNRDKDWFFCPVNYSNDRSYLASWIPTIELCEKKSFATILMDSWFCFRNKQDGWWGLIFCPVNKL